MEPLWFVIPVAAALRIRRQTIAADSTFSLGDPIVERVGVVGRRAAFVYPFTAHQIARIDAKRSVEGVTQRVFYDREPADWRPAPTGFGTDV